MSGSAGAEYGWVRMGTDGYGEKSHGFDHIFLRTNPYKSVQIQSFGLTAPRGGAKHPFYWGGSR